jgi:hypothetical protein
MFVDDTILVIVQRIEPEVHGGRLSLACAVTIDMQLDG